MADQAPITVEVEGIGTVTMIGTGPWSVQNNGHSREILDSTGAVSNPTVTQKFSTTTKPNRNVVFAKQTAATAVVEAANAALEAAAS